MVTLDLGTVGFYNRLVLFNIMNNAMNSGVIGPYRVSPTGFLFRALAGEFAFYHLGLFTGNPSTNCKMVRVS